MARTLTLFSPLVVCFSEEAKESNLARRLRVINGCRSHPIWVASEVNGGAAPEGQNVRIEPQGHHDFLTEAMDVGSRYWPKMWCDDDGNNCALGGSGGPDQSCVGPHDDYSKCAPAIDTKFEAVFGDTNAPCDPSNGNLKGCDHLDVSLVDGYTLPFKIEAHGSCRSEDQSVVDSRTIDCSRVTIDQCPRAERINDVSVNLVAKNPNTQQVVGCYSPCMKLIDDKWDNALAKGRSETDKDVVPYCCPTPPESPDACRSGPMPKSKYVTSVHDFCPGVYGFPYDSKMGLIRCDSKTLYEVTFYCPHPMPPEPTEEVRPLPGPTGSAPAATVTSAGPHKSLDDLAMNPTSPGGRPIPPELMHREGCGAICHTGEGRSSCGFRMQYAATTRYRGEVDACDLANVMVLLDCPNLCESCLVQNSGCEQAVKSGIASNVGSPYWVAAQEALIRRRRPKAEERHHSAPDAESDPVAAKADVASSGGAQQGLLPLLARAGAGMPFAIAAISVAVIVLAILAQLGAKFMGLQMPASRAADAALSGRGGLGASGPSSPSASYRPGSPTGFQYEGLPDQSATDKSRTALLSPSKKKPGKCTL